MALSKFGYTGTVNQDQWADIMGLSGVNYAVRTLADWLVSAVGGVRSVSIAAGQGVGFGVLVATDTPTVIPLAPPVNGRWDLITMRRDWGTPGNTAFVVTPHETLTGVGAPAAPPTTYPSSLGGNVNNGLGNVGTGVDHQPIAWVWHGSGSVVPLIFDLRTLPLESRIEAQIRTYASVAALPANARQFDRAIVGNLVYRHNGTAWKIWETIAPVTVALGWANLALGAATNTANYVISSGVLTIDGTLIFAADTVISGIAYPVMPFPGITTPAGGAWAFDNSATVWAAGVLNVGSYFLFGANRVAPGAPWVWAAGDQLRYSVNLILA